MKDFSSLPNTHYLPPETQSTQVDNDDWNDFKDENEKELNQHRIDYDNEILIKNLEKCDNPLLNKRKQNQLEAAAAGFWSKY